MSNKEDNGKKRADSFEPAAAAGQETSAAESPDAAAIDDLAAQLEAVTVERDRLAAENEELKDALLRHRAEFENFRRRVEKERAEFAEYAAAEAVRALLPILDDFERALSAVPPEIGPEHDYVKGIRIIYDRLLETLKKLGLEPIESVGKPFDPTVHHAVERVPTAGAEDETVLEEWQKGYNFKGKLLREAMVRVAVKPSTGESRDQEKPQS